MTKEIAAIKNTPVAVTVDAQLGQIAEWAERLPDREYRVRAVASNLTHYMLNSRASLAANEATVKQAADAQALAPDFVDFYNHEETPEDQSYQSARDEHERAFEEAKIEAFDLLTEGLAELIARLASSEPAPRVTIEARAGGEVYIDGERSKDDELNGLLQAGIEIERDDATPKNEGRTDKRP